MSYRFCSSLVDGTCDAEATINPDRNSTKVYRWGHAQGKGVPAKYSASAGVVPRVRRGLTPQSFRGNWPAGPSRGSGTERIPVNLIVSLRGRDSLL